MPKAKTKRKRVSHNIKSPKVKARNDCVSDTIDAIATAKKVPTIRGIYKGKSKVVGKNGKPLSNWQNEMKEIGSYCSKKISGKATKSDFDKLL